MSNNKDYFTKYVEDLSRSLNISYEEAMDRYNCILCNNEYVNKVKALEDIGLSSPEDDIEGYFIRSINNILGKILCIISHNNIEDIKASVIY